MAKERELYLGQVKESGKPEAAWDKIVTGKMDKYFSEICLMEQPFAKEQSKTVKQMIDEKIAKTGENIQIRRFARFLLGEGIEKKKSDLAAEVAEMSK